MTRMPVDLGADYRWPPDFQPFTGFGGMPGGMGLLPQLLLQFAASSNMTKHGMLPMSLLDQNMFDRFQSMQLTNMHQQMMQLGAEVDQGRQMQTMRGMMAMAGVPWGQEQLDASRRITDILRIGTPILAQLAPDFLDQLGGLRGSAAVMGHYTFYGSRMRIDPLTGRTGPEEPALQSMVQQIPERAFGGKGYRTGLTISEGDAGRMFAALQQRSMIAGSDAVQNANVVNQAIEQPGLPSCSGLSTPAPCRPSGHLELRVTIVSG